MSSANQQTHTYPLMLTNLAQVRCVVVGGGAVAERKVRDLIAGGARPVVISPTVTAALSNWHTAGQIEHVDRAYQSGDLAGAFLAVAATNDRGTNATVAEEAARMSILINVADAQWSGNFHTAATVRRGNLMIAISTSGGSPSLTAHIRRDIEARYRDEYGDLLALLTRLRKEARQRLTAEQQAQLWQRVITDEVLGWLRAGDVAAAKRYVDEQFRAIAQQQE